MVEPEADATKWSGPIFIEWAPAETFSMDSFWKRKANWHPCDAASSAARLSVKVPGNTRPQPSRVRCADHVWICHFSR
jgi:hypothetical protein